MYNKHIYVLRKGKKKYGRWLKVEEFVEIVAKTIVKQEKKYSKMGLEEAKKETRLAMWRNPKAIHDIMKQMDKDIIAWKVPHKLVWDK